MFPLGFGRQAIELAGNTRKPRAVLPRSDLRHADRGEALAAHVERHVDIGRSRLADAIGLLGLRQVSLVPAIQLVPGDLAPPHPEGRDADLDLRPLVFGPLRLRLGAAHREHAARNRHHVEAHRAAVNRLGIGLEAGRVRRRTDRRHRFGLVVGTATDEQGQQQPGDTTHDQESSSVDILLKKPLLLRRRRLCHLADTGRLARPHRAGPPHHMPQRKQSIRRG